MSISYDKVMKADYIEIEISDTNGDNPATVAGTWIRADYRLPEDVDDRFGARAAPKPGSLTLEGIASKDRSDMLDWVKKMIDGDNTLRLITVKQPYVQGGNPEFHRRFHDCFITRWSWGPFDHSSESQNVMETVDIQYGRMDDDWGANTGLANTA